MNNNNIHVYWSIIIALLEMPLWGVLHFRTQIYGSHWGHLCRKNFLISVSDVHICCLSYIWLVVWYIFIFPCLGNNNPNISQLTHIFQRWNHQPDMILIINMVDIDIHWCLIINIFSLYSFSVLGHS